MNATVMAYGLAVGGRAGARHALADIWRRIASLASFSPLQPTLFDRLTGNQSLETSPAFVQFDLMTRLFSPYQLNPFNINPLRSILCDAVDFDAIRNAHCPIKLSSRQLTCELERSAFLTTTRSDPTLFWPRLVYRFCSRRSKSTVSAIGMVVGNPAIFPLIYSCDSRVIVHIHPIERPEVPKTAGEILNRINEMLQLLVPARDAFSLLCDQADRGGEDYGQDHKAHVEADDVMQAMS